MRASVGVVWGALLLGATGCTFFDVNKLRRDGGLDAPTADTEAPVDTRPDTARLDAGPDTARPPMRSACASHPFTDLTNPALGPRFGPSLVVDGDTTPGPLAPSSLDPAPGCSMGTMASTERVFRYQVQNGPRVLATTNGAPCRRRSDMAGMGMPFDTVLYALNTCDTGRLYYRCNDDDGILLCSGCAGGATCNGEGSTIEVGPVVAGDWLYFVVDGYNGTQGTFRLSITENAAGLEGPNPMGASNLCECRPLPPATPAPMMVMFPRRDLSDSGNGALSAAGNAIAGTRSIGFQAVSAVAASFKLRTLQFPSTGACASARVVLDLLLNRVPVAAFSLSRAQDPEVVVNIPYTPVPGVVLMERIRVPLEYRVRAVDPPTCTPTVVLDMDAGGSNQVFVWGTT